MDLLEVESFMRGVGMAIDEHLTEHYRKTMGFCLLVFELGKPGVTHYISNAERSDMIKALKETIERFEKNQVIPVVTTGKQ